MANSFNIPLGFLPNLFVSKNGHDSNDGLTPDSPKKSVVSSPTDKTLIGPGVYTTSGAIHVIYGLGIVILDFQGTNLPVSTTFQWTNIRVKDLIGETGISSQVNNQMNNVYFDNCNLGFRLNVNSGRKVELNRCKIVGQSVKSTGAVGTVAYNKCIVIDAEIGVNNYHVEHRCYLTNSYVSRYSTVFLRNISASTQDLSYSNNIQGVISIHGAAFLDGQTKKYAIRDLLVGTPQDNGYDIDVKWLSEANLVADGYSDSLASDFDNLLLSQMNRDPKFTSIENGVFTLQSDSPMIGRATDSDNIGGEEIGRFIAPTDSSADTVIVYDEGIDLSVPNRPMLKAGFDEGTIRIVHKVVSGANPNPVNFSGIIGYRGGLNFDSDYAEGSLQNNNVPSAVPDVYPQELATTSSSPDASTVVSNGHGVSVGQWFRYAGQDRQVATVVDANIFTLDAPLRASINNLEVFQIGSEDQLAALNPNRLEVFWRTSKRASMPTLNSHWDNDLDPLLGYAGIYLPQELWTTPQKFIVANDVYGNASPDRPDGASSENYSLVWFDQLIKLRKGHK